MDDAESKRSHWPGPRKLCEPGWNALLSALDSSPERAARKYETARSGLIGIFRSRGLWSDAEDLTDETLDRVARRVLEKVGTPDAIGNIFAYMRVVAAKVAAEAHRRPRHVSIEEGSEPSTPAGVWWRERSDINEQALEYLRGLVDELPEQDRRIILEYYEYSRSEKIAHRRSLAWETARSAGALRVKACRIRHQLGERLRQALERERCHVKQSEGGP